MAQRETMLNTVPFNYESMFDGVSLPGLIEAQARRYSAPYGASPPDQIEVGPGMPTVERLVAEIAAMRRQLNALSGHQYSLVPPGNSTTERRDIGASGEDRGRRRMRSFFD